MKQIISLIIVVNLFVASPANAAVSDEEFQQLREQLVSISQRLDELAAENAELRAAHLQRCWCSWRHRDHSCRERANRTPLRP